MPAPTPGDVKNIIRRSLREIIDPSPSRKDEKQIWDYFNSECAYCGKKLREGYKEAHIDHLLSTSCGGANYLCNRVLSCATCNEEEKREKPWEEFLAQKCTSKQIESVRKAKIVAWQNMHKAPILGKDVLSKIDSLANEVASCYDEKVRKARGLRDKR